MQVWQFVQREATLSRHDGGHTMEAAATDARRHQQLLTSTIAAADTSTESTVVGGTTESSRTDDKSTPRSRHRRVTVAGDGIERAPDADARRRMTHPRVLRRRRGRLAIARQRTQRRKTSLQREDRGAIDSTGNVAGRRLRQMRTLGDVGSAQSGAVESRHVFAVAAALVQIVQHQR